MRFRRTLLRKSSTILSSFERKLQKVYAPDLKLRTVSLKGLEDLHNRAPVSQADFFTPKELLPTPDIGKAQKFGIQKVFSSVNTADGGRSAIYPDMDFILRDLHQSNDAAMDHNSVIFDDTDQMEGKFHHIRTSTIVEEPIADEPAADGQLDRSPELDKGAIPGTHNLG